MRAGAAAAGPRKREIFFEECLAEVLYAGSRNARKDVEVAFGPSDTSAARQRKFHKHKMMEEFSMAATARSALLVLTFAALLAAPALAGPTVLLDTFNDDPLAGPPVAPEIGSYNTVTPIGDFSIISALSNRRLNIRDVNTSGGYTLNYTPTASTVQPRVTYTFRVLSTNLVAANAFLQSLNVSPAGALSVYWGNDGLIRVRFVQGAVDNTYVSAFSFTQNVDYFVELEVDALADNFSLSINGSTLFTNQALGANVNTCGNLYFQSNFATTGTTQLDTVRMVDEYDPCDFDNTPPIAEIDVPPSFSCVCDPVQIKGTANDPDGTLQGWLLEYQPAFSNGWTVISAGANPVIANTLGIWNTGALAQGYYLLRLTVNNACGLSNTDVRVVYVDNAFDTVQVDYPADNQIVGGTVCFDGTVYDNCFLSYEVESVPASTFNLVSPNLPVINDPFAYWLTNNSPDGDYIVTVAGKTICGAFDFARLQLTIDNTPPVAVITSPTNCDNVSGIVPIVGTVSDLHFQSWVLQYTGGNQNGWVTIASGNNQVINDVIANWNTAGLLPCAYTLRLIAYDYSLIGCASYYQYTEFFTSVTVGDLCGGCLGDIDGSGLVDFFDIDPFVALLGQTCP